MDGKNSKLKNADIKNISAGIISNSIVAPNTRATIWRRENLFCLSVIFFKQSFQYLGGMAGLFTLHALHLRTAGIAGYEATLEGTRGDLTLPVLFIHGIAFLKVGYHMPVKTGHAATGYGYRQ